MLYSNPYYNKVCYKGTELYQITITIIVFTFLAKSLLCFSHIPGAKNFKT